MSHFSTDLLKVSEPSPHVLHIELARPPYNAFSREFYTAYGQTIDTIIKSDHDVRAIVVSSSLPKLFTSGIDTAELGSLGGKYPDPGRTSMGLRNTIKTFQHSIGAPERSPVPVIAAIHGLCMGLGVDLTSYCDIRYAASNSVFTIKEVDAGLAADIGTLAFLRHVTNNSSLARELAMTSRNFSAQEALSIGFVSKVIEGGREQVVQEALALAKVIASKSPVAVAGTKRLMLHARDHSVAENLEYTALWNSATLQNGDLELSVKGMKAKKTPEFPGLQPTSASKAKL